MNSPLETLSRLRAGRTRRMSSYDRTGANHDSVRIEPGHTATIARIEGPGTIKHIWFTIAHNDPLFGRNMVLRMYWDGMKRPSVECPLGDFFGQGWGEHYNYAALPLAASPAGGRGLNCYFPMPFADGAVITVENDSDEPCRAFYYYIDYQELDEAPAEHGRFHAFWSRSCSEPPGGVEARWADFQSGMKNLTDRFNHPIIDAEGRGHYVGVNYFVECPSIAWYGEGDDMFFIDGEAWPPSLHGTGTEDYFNCSWCPKEYYVHPYFGYPRVTDKDTGFLGRTHSYRFHIEDPVIFEKSLRGSIERGHANNMTLDIATAAYWYQTLPHKPFTPLPDRAGRQPMPKIDPKSFQIWRETWRQAQGGGTLWGNESLGGALSEKWLKKSRRAADMLAPAKNQKIAMEELKRQQAMLDPKPPRRGRKK